MRASALQTQNTGINKPVLLFDALLAYDLARFAPRFRGSRLLDYRICSQGFCYRGAPAQVISSLIYRW